MPKDVTLTRTYVLPRKALKALAPALLAVTRHAKDLENCATYAIRQVLSAYEDGQLKADLHDEQLAVIELANTCIERINEARVVKAHAKAELKPERDKPAKVLPLLTQSASPFGILDVTVLDNVVRELPSCHEVNAYRSLPGVAAQQCVRKVRGDFQNWLASLKAYARAPADFTGRAQMPGYRGKHERAIIKFPWASLSSGKFVGIHEKALFLDYAQEEPLAEEAKAAWLAFELSEAVTALAQARKLGDAKPLEVRLIPQGAVDTKVEVVFELGQVVQLTPLAQRLMQALEPGTVDSSVKAVPLTPKQREAKLKVEMASLKSGDFKHIAALDPGLNNLATVAFGSGRAGLVVSGQRIEEKLAHLDAKLDAAIAAATPAELKALQSKGDELRKTEQKLPKADFLRLKALRSQVHKDEHVMKLRALRANFVKDSAHRLTQGLVQRLMDAGVQVLVVGRNSGWKSAVDKGARFNRRLHRIPHALFLEQLRYKALAVGILVVTTEESYTSKTSFALNETLQVKKDKKEKVKVDTDVDKAPHSTSPMPDSPPSETREARTEELEATPVALAGKRRRHVFVSPGAPALWQKIHADLNGAFNILRKACLRFKWHPGLTPWYELLWLSPKKGLKAMRQTTTRSAGIARALPV